MDPLAGSAWSTPGTVAGFVASPPNATLLHYAEAWSARPSRLALDIGCGAARNLLPLAKSARAIKRGRRKTYLRISI